MSEEQPKPARVLIEVVSGFLPGTPIPEMTKQWAVTSEEWDGGSEKGFAILAQRNGQALGYAMLLMLSPDSTNWVRTDWIWL
ncbi:MAG TPA: hypothetical protein VIT65_23150 [Microlunatus sp.]